MSEAAKNERESRQCPACQARGLVSYLGSNGVCGRCWQKADAEADRE